MVIGSVSSGAAATSALSLNGQINLRTAIPQPVALLLPAVEKLRVRNLGIAVASAVFCRLRPCLVVGA